MQLLVFVIFSSCLKLVNLMLMLTRCQAGHKNWFHLLSQIEPLKTYNKLNRNKVYHAFTQGYKLLREMQFHIPCMIQKIA